MREYVVRPGDSPAQIAIEHVGCPKCAIDLVKANPHKEAVVYQNGFATFKSLSANEKINLPDKWFNGDLESRPDAYFKALPYPDGITPGLGDFHSGVLGDYAMLDAATIGLTKLGTMDDRAFASAVGEVAGLLDSAVREADGSVNPGIAAYAQAVHTATNWARAQGSALTTALDGGAGPAATEARLSAQNAISTAIESAHLALQAVYAGQPPEPSPPTPAPTPGGPSPLIAVAQAAVAAISSDPNYCASVARVGSSVNSAVHSFKAAWNASGQTPVPINTGNYEQATANALASLIGTAPTACGARASTPSTTKPSTSRPVTVVAPSKRGLSTGAVAGIALLGAAAVGGAIYVVTNKPFRRRRLRRRKAREEANL